MISGKVCHRTLLTVILFCGMTVMAHAQIKISDLFREMPDSLLPVLSENNRLDMIDFMDAKMKAVVTNSLGGETEMVFISDDSLVVKMNESCLLSMKTMQVDTAMVVVLRRTYYTKRNQYEVVSQTFNSYWLPLSKPVIESTLLKRDDDLRNLPHF